MFEILRELDALRAIAGSEDAVRDYIHKKVKPYAQEIVIDPVGNLLVFKKGSKKRNKPVMICAHMDEDGFRIQKIKEDGTLQFAPVGLPAQSAFFGNRVCVGKDGAIGTIMVDSFVRMRKDRSLPSPKDWYIDIGAADVKSAENVTALGDMVTFYGEWRELPNNKIKGRALESRIGCAVLISIITEDIPYDTWFVFTTQDSIKARKSCGRGAMVASSRLQPKSILYVEAREAYDFEALPEYRRVMVLGNGCAIALADKGSAYTRPLRKLVTAKADELRIPYQYPTCFKGVQPTSRTATTASESASCMCIAAPVRYLHTPNAIANKKDIEAMKSISRIYISVTEVYHD